MKWFENPESGNDVFTASRVRISRNIEGYKFPEKLSEEEQKELTDLLAEKLTGIGLEEGQPFRYYALSDLTESEKNALKERHVLHEKSVTEKKASGFFLSEDESTAVVLNRDDHIRIHRFGLGMNLNRLGAACDRLDDWINERFSYAFDEKYGYLTSYPTNMGTGLRVSVLLHLPYLQEGKNFRKLLQEVERTGVRVRGLVGEGPENYGGLFEISNQKTLGLSEEEIFSMVYRMASHIAVNERKVRSMTLRENRLAVEDQAGKAYGVLKYAKQLSEKDALIYLSAVRAGLCEGLLSAENPTDLFQAMWTCRDGCIRERHIGDMTPMEVNAARAEMVRAYLPEIR